MPLFVHADDIMTVVLCMRFMFVIMIYMIIFYVNYCIRGCEEGEDIKGRRRRDNARKERIIEIRTRIERGRMR